ncbi:PEPxxWA-CTERM sorting domain-containing protein [Novosphingobium sp. G106]|uniref:PEPxxWA-CTERM sorting domain-containing protein n=1 Tax=Novosphingobium sp. G106 TaxID=2849500 RepID=UPI0020C2E241|nr:PEPxxWA-CTERM sorting domain-containing protein [Novosphingobium sp. G106]
MTKRFRFSTLCLATALTLVSTQVSAATVTLTKLSGVTGDNPANTAVFAADLTAYGDNVTSILIRDASNFTGGSPGQFSGFDLDAIKLSLSPCATAACVAGLAGLSVFNFGAGGTVFTPGTQRPTVNARLFGTTGANVFDNSIATLGAFDADSSTTLPAGFLSLGDNGQIMFNLTSAVKLNGLWLYIGEVGNNGEKANSAIEIFSNSVPEPSTWAMMILGIGFAGAAMRRRQRVSVSYA